MAHARHPLRPILLCLLAVSSFALVSSWIRVGVPWREALGVRAKLQAFEETKNEYDAIFIGSSSVLRAIRPGIIDPVVSRRGEKFRSYNLGFPGMWSFEADHLLDEIIAMEPTRLRWVVVEAPLWKADLFSNERNINERSVRWHTPARTAQALWSIYLEDHPFDEKLRVGWQHLKQMAMRSGNYALGPNWWQARFVSPSPEFTSNVQRFRESRGYRALEVFDIPGTKNRRTVFRRDREDFVEAARVLAESQLAGHETDQSGPVLFVAGQTEAAGNSIAFESYNAEALRSQRDRLTARDLNPVYLVLPRLIPGRLFVDLHRRGELPVLMDYKQPARYPDFFSVKSHFDFSHLSRSGSKLFSQQFAQDFVALISAEPES